MTIGGLQKLTLADYPGKLACTVFFTGCSFRCPWCHNPELVLPEQIRENPGLSDQEFFSFLKRREGALEAVVLGGGEPTLSPYLFKICKKIKDLGYEIKLDTNGSNPDVVEELVNERLVDYIAMDIKAPKEKYLEIVGLKNSFRGLAPSKISFLQKEILNKIEQSIAFLKKNRTDYEFRTTVIPGLLAKNDIVKIVKWIAPAKRYYLQDFLPGKTIDEGFSAKKPYDREYLIEILYFAKPFFEVCELRAD